MPFLFLAFFVAPGLTDKERGCKARLLAAFLLFNRSVLCIFCYSSAYPVVFSVTEYVLDFDLFWAASDYYSMVVWFSLATGAFFTSIIVILVYLGVIPVQRLKDIRREVLVGLMVFAAFMTPGGDFVSLPLITGFMYGLYELAIWVGIRVEKKRQEELEEWDIE